MWSYSAPDRTPKPPVAPPYDGVERVARRHQKPVPRGTRLRLVTRQDTDIRYQEEETS